MQLFSVFKFGILLSFFFFNNILLYLIKTHVEDFCLCSGTVYRVFLNSMFINNFRYFTCETIWAEVHLEGQNFEYCLKFLSLTKSSLAHRSIDTLLFPNVL